MSYERNEMDITKEQVEAFLKDYDKLCRKHKMIHSYVPSWNQSKDIGDYRLVILPRVERYEPEEENPPS